ncbi:MAG: methylmalonyl-CoA mutase [Bacteroidetes bacterium]|nr:methylmalonyl-CoA mutase [Bacteroidota bacterium]
MFPKITTSDWENLVKKQLKTEDIYPQLTKENLEGIVVKPYYHNHQQYFPTLPKIEESTQLVSNYLEDSEDEIYAYLLNNNVENLTDKSIYIANKDLAEHIKIEDDNNYYALVDVLNENTASIDEVLAKELLSKGLQKSICVDIAFLQNAGASIIQQLGYAMAKIKELVENFGIEVMDKIIIKTAIGGNYFFEIAKIRAFKILFYQLSKELGIASIPYIFAETSHRNKSVFDEENNLIRSTLELAAAMIGGADVVYSHNYKINNPSDLSGEISFKQQIVLAYESIINVFEDAANGSYFVEDITQQMAEKSWQLLVEIEEEGGYIELLKTGKIQNNIYQHATKEQQWVVDGKIKLIGVNMFPKLETTKSIDQLYNSNEIKEVRWSEMYE